MSRRGSAVVVLPICLLLGACGSSKHASTSSTASSTTATSARSTATTSTGQSGTPSSATSTTPATGGAAPTATAPGGGGSTTARIPATFVIRAGGKLDPPSVSAPSLLAVQLTMVSADGRPHQVLLRTPMPHSLTVPAHGRASLLIRGPRSGRYELDVDGVARGTLTLGGEPGP